MLHKRLSTGIVLLVLCLSLPFLRLHAGPPTHPGRLAITGGRPVHADLAVGAPGEDIGDSAADAGAVNVLYSVYGGVGSDYNQMWHQDNLSGDSEAEVFDAFGSALAAGDFNGDGYDDLAIGVPQEDVTVSSSLSNAGVVQVLYGAPAGLSIAGMQGWCQGGCSGLRETAEDGDQFGAELAAGDFNADGYDDLAVGVPNEDVGANADAGAVNVIYGSHHGLSLLSAVSDQVWHQDSPGVEGGVEPYDRFGTTLAAGDFDGDGYDDLAIGVPYEHIGDIADAGAVNILYGSNAGLTSAGDQILDQGDQLQGEPEELDLFGYALAAGHLSAGNCEDLAIGVRNEDVGAVSSAGAVNVVYGSPAGLAAAGEQLFDQGSLLLGAPEANDFFGSALAIGDFNCDGHGDLAVGVPREDVGDQADAGAINVIFGNAGGLSASGNVLWTEDDAWPGLAEAGEQVGYALAAGDLDGDGHDDLVIGVPYQDVGPTLSAGAFDILYSYADWPRASVIGYSQDTGGILGQSESGDHFGMELAIGDWRGFRTYLPIVTRE